MAFIVPTYTAPGQAWQLTDYKPALTQQATADSTGRAVVTFDPVPPGYMYAVQRAVVTSTSGATPTVLFYDDGVGNGVPVTGSRTGTFDEADYPAGPGLLVDQSRQLVAVFTGCDAGARCTVRLQVGVLSEITVG